MPGKFMILGRLTAVCRHRASDRFGAWETGWSDRELRCKTTSGRWGARPRSAKRAVTGAMTTEEAVTGWQGGGTGERGVGGSDVYSREVQGSAEARATLSRRQPIDSVPVHARLGTSSPTVV